jgi:hypothetical protein
MAIYDFPDAEKRDLKASAMPQKRHFEEEPSAIPVESQPIKSDVRSQIFSAATARLLFLLLFAADLLWICYSFLVFLFSSVGHGVTRGRTDYFKNLFERSWITLRRSIVCGVSLMVALFSPAFGIMIACTYFLMYDKSGIEEVIPASLQSQFKEFLPQGIKEEG